MELTPTLVVVLMGSQAVTASPESTCVTQSPVRMGQLVRTGKASLSVTVPRDLLDRSVTVWWTGVSVNLVIMGLNVLNMAPISPVHVPMDGLERPVT